MRKAYPKLFKNTLWKACVVIYPNWRITLSKLRVAQAFTIWAFADKSLYKSALLLAVLHIRVSSTKRLVELGSSSSPKSLIKMSQSKTLSAELCGIPFLRGYIVDIALRWCTLKCLSQSQLG